MSRLLGVVGLASAGVLAGIFMFSGIAKLPDPNSFAAAIARYEALPNAATPWLAMYLPWLEICVGFALFPPRWRSAAMLVGGLLLLGFTIVLAIAWFGGDTGECGCGGMLQLSIPAAFARNIAMMVLVALWVLAGRWATRSRASANAACPKEP